MRNIVLGIVFAYCIGVGSAFATTVLYDADDAYQATYVSEIPLDGKKGASVFERVDFINGTNGSVANLGALDQGWYQLTLTDFVLPTQFEDLRVAITTATQLVSMVKLDEGYNQSISYLHLDDNDSYYLSIYGQAGGNGYALYGVDLSHFVTSPVPVPASILLLFTGLMAWGATSLKRKQVN